MALFLKSTMTEALILLLGVILVIHRYLTSRFDYWQKLGLPYLQPQPFFGNVRDFVLMRVSNSELTQRLYREGAPHRVVGFFQQSSPSLLIRDPELVKNILIKDFMHFSNRFNEAFKPSGALSQNLFFVGAHRWRPLRSKLSPTFSSGRIKGMFPLLAECASTFQESVAQQVATGQQDIEVRDALAKFSTDVIGTCAFGLQCNAIQDPDSPFRAVGREIFRPKPALFAIRFLFEAFPVLIKLAPSFGNKSVDNFFLKLVKDTVDDRREKGLTRNDFLQLMIQLKEKGHLDGDKSSLTQKEETFEITDELLTAQCFVFFAAGFETSSTTMSFCLHELAKNEDIQDRLRREIDAVLAKHGGQLTYEGIQDMAYLDQVISETLRMYPPLSFLERNCVVPYKIPGTEATLSVGDRVILPACALQMDPQYFPDPERFDPERFNETNRGNIDKGAYLPFGDGPRNCIGMRFGLLQTKVGLAAILSRFRVSISPKSQLDLKLSPLSFVTMPKGGIVLRVEPRAASSH